MKRASLIAAGSIIVIANAFALMHGVRNRMGSPEAEVTLTQRELRYFNRSLSDDDSGVTLNLEWTDPASFPLPAQVENPANWLDQQTLQRLGFDCSVNPASQDAERFYQRQRPRQVFVALENDGAAWRDLPETYDPLHRSHLVAIDGDLDAGKLRSRNPDRTSVVILPAVVAITLNNFPYPGMKLDPQRPVQIRGHIQQLPSSIHVPRPFSDEFRRLGQVRGGTGNKELLYRVHLRYGASLEPWVTGVEFTNR